jgi:Flp pilus assembly protein TadD
MKKMTDLPGLTLVRTYLFGSFGLYRHEEKHNFVFRVDRARMAVVAGAALLTCYTLVVFAGYLWLRNERKIERVGFFDVAFVRVKKVRQEMAVQQFTKGGESLAAKNYTEAFIELSSGVHNDPDNIAGRLQLARLLELCGAAGRAVGLMEEGLKRAPGDASLVEATLAALIATGRSDEALKLLHGDLAPQYSGANGALLRTEELEATLNSAGPGAAYRLIDNYPELRTTPRSLPAVAQVQWAAQDRQAAIDTASAYVKARPDDLPGYVTLAGYQQTAGRIEDARKTADDACAHFPHEFTARLARVAVLEPTKPSEVKKWAVEIGAYIEDFKSDPTALTGLAQLAGQKGWVDTARIVYEAETARQKNVGMLAMYYADALMVHHRSQEALRVLAELDRQNSDAANQFSIYLWQREIVAAAACGDHDQARDSARRVASALRRDPDGLDSIRRHFVKLNIPEAVAELTVSAPEPKPGEPKKS